MATQKVIEEEPETVTAVLQALLDAESVVLSDPGEAQAAVSRVVSGTLSMEDIATAWSDTEHRMNLDQSLVDLMVDEGVWIRERGSIRGDLPTPETISAYVAPEFLAGIDASRTTLD